ncbi:MAG: PAS domain S-box protein [Anaerolineae bacterium]|nr:PAS domain S-box protein [Anaerolineae bacterium]
MRCTKSQFLNELAELRQRIAELETLRTGYLSAAVSKRHDTANHQHREALETSEIRYRRLFEAAQDGILILDAETGKITDVNPFLIKLLGYSYENLLGKALWEIGPFKNIGESRTAFLELQSKEYIRYEDLPLETNQGRRIDVEFISNVYMVDHKKVIQCNVRDITQRKQAENILQLRLRLLEFAADHSFEALVQKALDEIGQITASPISFYHLIEADQKTLSFQTWPTRARQEFCKVGSSLHADIDQAGVWAECVRLRRPVIHNDYAALLHRKGMPDGHVEIKRELVVPTLRAGHIVAILGIGNKPTDYDEQDTKLVVYVADIVWTIIEHKQSEALLQDYQHRLEAQNLELCKLSLAIEQSGSTIVMTDTEGNVQYANPRFEETSGYTLQETLGQNLRILKSGEQNADYYQKLWETITGGQIWRGEFQNRRKDGRLYWESATIAPVHNAAGEITHYIAVKEDITERRQAQEILHRYAEQLATQNAELDTFAHTVAHDLKNPIGIIIGFAELLVNDPEPVSPEETAESLRYILQTGKKLDRIIEELMLLAGVRKLEIAPEPLDMSSVVREAIERLQILIQDRHAQIILRDEAAWPVVFGHAPWIEEVWANYISNAIKYGGRPPQVEVGADPLPTPAGESQVRECRFWVRDNGPGLTAEAQSNLFTPFTRLDQVRAKGHGLGLSIVRRIVEKLGGRAGMESEVGQGSTFFFTLPTRE